MTPRKQRILRALAKIASKIMSRRFYTRLLFRFAVKHRLDLQNPQMLSEKLCWMKLYYFPKDQLAIKCTDKYMVREHIESIGMSEYLNELLGVWDDARKIDFNVLPDQFVLKCTHGSGYNIIVEDNSKLDIKKTRRQLNKWLRENYGDINAEPHYDSLRKTARIICEKFLMSEIVDYKFFCFHGKFEFGMLILHEKGLKQFITFDKEGSLAPFTRADLAQTNTEFTMPDQFDEMRELSETLAANFPFVRVDWYCVDGKIYFGELTFVPTAGLMFFNPPKYDRILGDLLNIKKCNLK